MATERDYYDVLGVERDASDSAIKKRFRQLARELHPDVSDDPDSEARFRQVAEAYEALSDPERRRIYDQYGHQGLRGGGFRPTDFDFGNIQDVFAAFFGEGLFGGGGRGSRASRGGDVGAELSITLAEAVEGVTKEVSLRVARLCGTCAGSGAAPGTSPTTCETCGGAGRVQRVSQSIFGSVVRAGSCPDCDGRGQVVATPCETCDGGRRVIEDVTLEVEVPPGIHDGQRIRIRGEGHAGEPGAPHGDVYVHIGVQPLAGVAREGDNLIAIADVTMLQAALGASVEVATPEGPLTVDLEAGTQPGDVRRIRGRGMPSLETGRRGDLLVHVAVRVPRKLSDEQREALARLEVEIDPAAYDGGEEEEEGFFARLRSALR